MHISFGNKSSNGGGSWVELGTDLGKRLVNARGAVKLKFASGMKVRMGAGYYCKLNYRVFNYGSQCERQRRENALVCLASSTSIDLLGSCVDLTPDSAI